ncbi:hypothetical protein BDW74DRAFT_182572 [Aspergillus multicolor]|uniref:uncharacterized protein n=1 Tax=Aspergillus multicolor TaxID=41759 RepID=UPI003CCD38A0
MVRILAEMGPRIDKLTCSVDAENEEAFETFLAQAPQETRAHASFFLGPMHHLTTDLRRSRPDPKKFSDAGGFDVIPEDTTFQMYSPNRKAQIGFTLEKLKPHGIRYPGVCVPGKAYRIW